jgi:hypothetical protein
MVPTFPTTPKATENGVLNIALSWKTLRWEMLVE